MQESRPDPILLYRTREALLVVAGSKSTRLDESLDELLVHDDLADRLLERLEANAAQQSGPDLSSLLPPIGSQEVWAAGVTYYRSREARMEEAKSAGGSDFYDRVYAADRPELFFKASASRVVGHGGALRLRSDSSWIVPEPELTLVLNASGKIVGYTIGNDLSCRDIEGENPLYLPQAKTFDACAGLGPCILIHEDGLPTSTAILLEVKRGDDVVFGASTQLSQLKRSFEELARWLFAETSFPRGCFLMTGTGIVPPDDFSLRDNDMVRITIEPIGTLENTVRTDHPQCVT